MNINLVRLKAVANVLGELNQKFVFVGGATVILYATHRSLHVPRPTDDVDIVIELASYAKYNALEEKLLEIGFVNDTESKIISRYLYQGLIIDLMPTDPEILGFSNQWYVEGFKTAEAVKLDEETEILIFAAPLFIASKLVAFFNRGEGDMRTSSDFEDIVFVLEARENLLQEIETSSAEVKKFLQESFRMLLKNKHIDEGIACHLDYYGGTENLQKIKKIMKEVIGL